VLTVSVDAAGLAPGSYDGSITLSAFGAANMTIPVALTVLDPNTQVKAAGGDAQTGAVGQALPSPLVVQVTGSDGAPPGYRWPSPSRPARRPSVPAAYPPVRTEQPG
jgi:hypothetical protein